MPPYRLKSFTLTYKMSLSESVYIARQLRTQWAADRAAVLDLFAGCRTFFTGAFSDLRIRTESFVREILASRASRHYPLSSASHASFQESTSTRRARNVSLPAKPRRVPAVSGIPRAVAESSTHLELGRFPPPILAGMMGGRGPAPPLSSLPRPPQRLATPKSGSPEKASPLAKLLPELSDGSPDAAAIPTLRTHVLRQQSSCVLKPVPPVSVHTGPTTFRRHHSPVGHRSSGPEGDSFAGVGIGPLSSELILEVGSHPSSSSGSPGGLSRAA